MTDEMDDVVERINRRLASRFSRRSLLGSIGKGAIALCAAGAGVELTAPDAVASACGGNTTSITCSTLTGSNACPANTCGCGFWQICDQTECSHAAGKVWSDCCAQYSCSCTCPSGFPSCCFTKEWGQGCGSGASHIVCRRWYCGSGGC
jgi:hypothetical protein